MDWVWVWDGMGWDLCAGLFYEHRFAMLIKVSLDHTLYVISDFFIFEAVDQSRPTLPCSSASTV